MTPARTRRHRLITRIVSKSGDLSTPLFAALFLGFLGLLPNVPERKAPGPEPMEMSVFLTSVRLDELALVDRPYLITLPTEASFGADRLLVEKETILPALEYTMAQGLFGDHGDSMLVEEKKGGRVLRGSLFEMGDVLPRGREKGRGISFDSVGASGLRVEPSSSLDPLKISKPEWLADQLPDASLPWEATLWVAFDDTGVLEHVFLDQSSRFPEIDRELVRFCWHPDLWYGGKGQGLIRVYYEPGERNEIKSKASGVEQQSS